MTNTATFPTGPANSRLLSIDALRGMVIVLMLLDHVRETFFLHRQVSDPMDIATTEPALFLSRTLAHLCAPVFVLLTGLSAWLYGEKYAGTSDVCSFLFKRGLFLVVLEFTLVNFAWTFQFPPTVIYLQVIWAIGLSMIALSVMVWLPRALLLLLSLAIIAGHNALDALHFPVDSVMHIPWAILHDRGWIELSEGLRLRTSYPVLPWIGVIGLGYAIGPWFSRAMDASKRQRQLVLCGVFGVCGFIALRLLNGYGEKPWSAGDTGVQTLMSFFNITKYPPSLLFVTLTLSVGFLLLLGFERAQKYRCLRPLTVFGSAPMFFYLLHLYSLKVLYIIAVSLFGLNQGTWFGFDSVSSVWLAAAALAVALYRPVKWFAELKARRRDIAWLKYL